MSWFGHDLAGMALAFGGLIGVGLLIAFVVAALIIRLWPHLRTLGYVLAGAVALTCMHLLLTYAFDITPIAIARTHLGIAVQGLAGAVGGYIFAKVSARPY